MGNMIRMMVRRLRRGLTQLDLAALQVSAPAAFRRRIDELVKSEGEFLDGYLRDQHIDYAERQDLVLAVLEDYLTWAGRGELLADPGDPARLTNDLCYRRPVLRGFARMRVATFKMDAVLYGLPFARAAARSFDNIGVKRWARFMLRLAGGLALGAVLADVLHDALRGAT